MKSTTDLARKISPSRVFNVLENGTDYLKENKSRKVTQLSFPIVARLSLPFYPLNHCKGFLSVLL